MENWFDEELTSGEKLLLTFPSLNALTAKLMLEKTGSVRNLLKFSMDQLKTLFPSLPAHVLTSFFNVAHTSSEMGGFVANNNILPAPPASALPENCIVIEDEQSQANQSRPQPTYRPAVQGIPPKTPTASRPSNIRQQAPTLSMPNIPLSVNFGEKVEYSDRNRAPPRTPKPRSRIGNITPSADILGPGGNVAVPTPKRQVRQELVFMKPERQVPNVSVTHHVENNKQGMMNVPKPTSAPLTFNQQESSYEDRRVPCTNVDIGSFTSFQNIESSFYDQYDSTTTQSYNMNNMNNIVSNNNFNLTDSNTEAPRVHEKQTDTQLVPDTTNSTDFVSGFQRFEGLFPSDSQDSVESFKLNLPSVEDGEPVCPLLDENTAPPPVVAYHKENISGGDFYDGQYRQHAFNDQSETRSELQVGYTDAFGGSTSVAQQAVGPSVGRFDRFIERDVSSAPVVGHSVTHTNTFSNESSRQRNLFTQDDPTPHNAFKGVGNVSRSLFTEEAASPFDVFAHSLQPSKNDPRRTNDSRGIGHSLMGPSSNGQFNRDFNRPFQNIQPPGSGDFGPSDPRQPPQQHQQQQQPHRRSFWQQPRELPQQAVKAFAVSPTVRNNDNRNINNNNNNRSLGNNNNNNHNFNNNNHNMNNINHHQNSINRDINNMNNYNNNNSNQHGTPRINSNNHNSNNNNNYSYHDNDGGGGWDTQQGSWGKAPSECKKRKLGFKKVPGAKGGQTKLTFV